MKIKIRRAQKKDVNNIFNLGNKLKDLLKASKQQKGHFHEKSEFLEFIKKPKNDILLVAEINNKFMGFICAEIIDKDWCLLDNIAIDKRYWGRGIGTKLINELYKILRKKKVDYIQLLVEKSHIQTQKFWKSKGFKEGKTFVWFDKYID
jgi:ribosomal protein S18 acetylase RimI-like enzyme